MIVEIQCRSGSVVEHVIG